MRPPSIARRPSSSALSACGDLASALVGGIVAGPLVLASGLFALAVVGGRTSPTTQTTLTDARRVAGRLAVGVGILTAIEGSHQRQILGALVALAASICTRTIEQQVQNRRMARSGAGERTVLVGSPADVERTARMLARHPEHGFRPVATVTPHGGNPTVLPGGAMVELRTVVAEHGAEHVLLTTPSLERALADAFGRSRPAGVRLSVLPPLAELMTAGAEVVDVRGLPLLTLAPRRAAEGPPWWAKRALDYVAATIGLLVLSPVLVLIAIAIKLDSPGPVLFRQTRVGRDGRTFRMLKFRSMVVDAEARLAELEALNEANGPFFKMTDDPRVTRVGRVLRRFCIDELPQLVNVVAGDMSLVGPRPCLTNELAAAPELFDWRLPLLPGMTGLWQLAGRSWLPVEEGLRLDLTYVEHWSVWLDIQLVLATLVMAAGGTRRPSPTDLEDRAALDRGRYARLVEGDDLRPRIEVCDVSIVVVAHESAADIDRCLQSTRVIRGVSAEVIVVDNASTDGTADLVERAHPEVRVIRKAGRHGFATNCNIGAVAASGRHLLFLNPDAFVTEGAVEELVAFLDAHPQVGAVGPKLVYPNGSRQPSARRFPTVGAALIRRTPLRWVLRRTEVERRHLMLDDDLGSSGPADVDWLLGAAIMIRSATYASMGGMDDRYRLYCEDIDLCRRLHEQGYRVVLVPSAVVGHDLSELTRRRFLTRATLWHARSMARFVRVHGLARPRPVERPIAVPAPPVAAPSAVGPSVTVPSSIALVAPAPEWVHLDLTLATVIDLRDHEHQVEIEIEPAGSPEHG